MKEYDKYLSTAEAEASLYIGLDKHAHIQKEIKKLKRIHKHLNRMIVLEDVKIRNSVIKKAFRIATTLSVYTRTHYMEFTANLLFSLSLAMALDRNGSNSLLNVSDDSVIDSADKHEEIKLILSNINYVDLYNRVLKHRWRCTESWILGYLYKHIGEGKLNRNFNRIHYSKDYIPKWVLDILA